MPEEWVSVGEASRRLNVSPSTVRRMIESGALMGEREVIGGSKERYRVRFDAPGDASESEPHSESPDASTTPQEPPAAILGLLAELREMRQEHERRRVADASTIADLRERVGRAEAESESRASALEWTETQRAELQAEVEALKARRWWKWW